MPLGVRGGCVCATRARPTRIVCPVGARARTLVKTPLETLVHGVEVPVVDDGYMALPFPLAGYMALPFPLVSRRGEGPPHPDAHHVPVVHTHGQDHTGVRRLI